VDIVRVEPGVLEREYAFVYTADPLWIMISNVCVVKLAISC
jgi:hypothetical protein